MNVMNRLAVIGAVFDLSSKELLGCLIKFSRDAGKDVGYPSDPTIRHHFAETKTRNGDVVQADGAKALPKNEKFIALTNDFVRCKYQENGEVYDENLSLTSDIATFLRASELEAAEFSSFLSETTKAVVDVVISGVERQSLHLPDGLRLSSSEMREEALKFLGTFGLYRLRGGQNRNKIVLEESLQITLTGTVEITYTDHRGETFRGTLIVGRDRASSTLISTTSQLHNLRVCHVTLFTAAAGEKVIAHVSRHLDAGSAHSYRAVLVVKGQTFEGQGILKWSDPKVVEVLEAIDNSQPITNDVDSSFAISRDLLEGKLERGKTLCQLYRTRLAKGDKKFLSQPNLESLLSDLEKIARN